MPITTDFPGVGRQFGGPAYVHMDLREMLPRYQLIRDCLSGSQRVKQARQLYLPKQTPPSAKDRDSEQRYVDYVRRAVFYNVAKRTSRALIGEIFGREPQSVLTPLLDTISTNISGDGLSVDQVARQITGYSLDYGRCGLLIDYPDTQGEATSRASLIEGAIAPVILPFSPWQVINWRSEYIGTKQVLTLVVIYEGFGVQDDGFETKSDVQFRELRLDPVTNNYTVNVWRRNSVNFASQAGAPSNNRFGIYTSYVPLDHTGQPLKEIPFMFVGSDANNHSIDEPPMYDLAELNIAHYRNSADYEELTYMQGQPSYYFTGLDETWVETYFEGKVFVGSRSSIVLPSGATAGILQIQSNGQIKEAMTQKEDQMAALGARIIQQRSVQRTATEASLEDAAENSELGLIAINASAAMTWALNQCALFLDGNQTNIDYQLNTSFDLSQLAADERLQLMKEWQAGAISWTEYRAQLAKSGIATQPDDEAKAEIEEELTNVYGGTNPTVFDTAVKPSLPVPAGATGATGAAV